MIKPKKTIIKDAIESSKEEKYSISFNLLSVALASVSIAFSEAGGHKYAPWCFIAIALLLLLFSFFVLKRKNNKKYIWILLICTSTLVIALIAFSLNKMYKASKTSGEADNKMESAVINTITPTPTTKIIKYAAEETPSLAGYFTNKYPANEYSAEKLIALGDYFYQTEMYDKAIECYLSNQVITDSNARKSVQAKLGYCFLYGENQISDDPQLREQYILVALNFFDAALTEGDYSALTTIIIIRAYTIKAYYYVTSYSFDKLIDNIELAYEVKNETISKWISAMMRDQGYIESEDGYLEQFCNRLSSYDQMVLLSNLVDPSWSSYFDSYTEYHPNVSSEDGYHQETLVNEYNGIYTYKVSDYIPTYRYYEFFVDKDMYDFFHSNTEEFLGESK